MLLKLNALTQLHRLAEEQWDLFLEKSSHQYSVGRPVT